MTWDEWKAEGERLGIPERGVRAFLTHASGARRRGIEFLFTLPDWWAWWQTDGRWERRGNRGHQLVMARREDIGPYTPSNVFPATSSQNFSEWARRPRGNRMRTASNGQTRYMGAVETPLGAFSDVRTASEASGISVKTALAWLRAGQEGWRFTETGANGVCALTRSVEWLGMNLRAARKKLGMSQKDVSDAAGVDRAGIAHLERGTGNPTFNMICALARAVSLKPDELLASPQDARVSRRPARDYLLILGKSRTSKPTKRDFLRLDPLRGRETAPDRHPCLPGDIQRRPTNAL